MIQLENQQKTWTNISLKGHWHGKYTSTWKDGWYDEPSEKYKLKPQWNITTHWSEWLKSNSLLLGDAKWYSHFVNHSGSFLRSKASSIPWSRNRTSQYLPKWVENVICTNPCTQVFTAVLLINSKNYKQSRSLLLDEQVNKHIHTLEHYSADFKNKLSSHKS